MVGSNLSTEVNRPGSRVSQRRGGQGHDRHHPQACPLLQASAGQACRGWASPKSSACRMPPPSPERSKRSQVGTALPPRLGAKPVGPGAGDRRPPRAAAAARGAKEPGRGMDGSAQASFESVDLIASGAFPDAYTAALLASEREPSDNCGNCSAPNPRYYLFEKESAPQAVELAAAKRTSMRAQPAKRCRKTGSSSKSRSGTVLVSELPTEPNGRVDETAQPGWFALKDDPALSGSEITEPKQEYAAGSSRLAISAFGFTPKWKAFSATRVIAERGQAQATGPVSREEAAALFGPLRGHLRRRGRKPTILLRRKSRWDRRPP